MNNAIEAFYSPALRLKDGELGGVWRLASDVARYVLPRFIIPPRSDRSPSALLPLEMSETPDISGGLAAHWRNRPVLVDSTYLLDEYGRDRMLTWFPQMFDRARNRLVQAIPMVLLRDIGADEVPGIRAAIQSGDDVKFAICMTSGEMVGPRVFSETRRALDQLGVTPGECIAIADFAGTDFGNPDSVAPVIGATLEALQEIGNWNRVIFQGTSFPEHNSVAPGCRGYWPRNEWLAWRRATQLDAATADHMMFGDYAADSAKMEFNGNGRAIRHLRYTVGAQWLVQRGGMGSDRQVMRSVCHEIVCSGQFAGSGFSDADDYIYRASLGSEGPGNATTWRQLNTTHHITQVVADLAKGRGLAIARSPAPPTEPVFDL